MKKARNSSWSSVKAHNIICETWWIIVMVWAWLPVELGYWCLVMMWQKTEAAGSILKCIKIYSAQIQLNATTFIGRCFIIQMDNGPKHYSKSNPGGKKVYYSAMAESISCSQPDWACISLAEDKTQGGKTHKQTTTEVPMNHGNLYVYVITCTY